MTHKVLKYQEGIKEYLMVEDIFDRILKLEDDIRKNGNYNESTEDPIYDSNNHEEMMLICASPSEKTEINEFGKNRFINYANLINNVEKYTLELLKLLELLKKPIEDLSLKNNFFSTFVFIDNFKNSLKGIIDSNFHEKHYIKYLSINPYENLTDKYIYFSNIVIIYLENIYKELNNLYELSNPKEKEITYKNITDLIDVGLQMNISEYHNLKKQERNIIGNPN